MESEAPFLSLIQIEVLISQVCHGLLVLDTAPRDCSRSWDFVSDPGDGLAMRETKVDFCLFLWVLQECGRARQSLDP